MCRNISFGRNIHLWPHEHCSLSNPMTNHMSDSLTLYNSRQHSNFRHIINTSNPSDRWSEWWPKLTDPMTNHMTGSMADSPNNPLIKTKTVRFKRRCNWTSTKIGMMMRIDELGRIVCGLSPGNGTFKLLTPQLWDSESPWEVYFFFSQCFV